VRGALLVGSIGLAPHLVLPCSPPSHCSGLVPRPRYRSSGTGSSTSGFLYRSPRFSTPSSAVRARNCDKLSHRI
jgi:hypothetical protein